MTASLVLTIAWTLPFAAALVIGVAVLAGWAASERQERATRRLALAASVGSVVAVVVAATAHLAGALGHASSELVWFTSGHLRVVVAYSLAPLGLWTAVLWSAACALAATFAVNYMHREAGFHRFFGVLCLFQAAVVLLAVSDEAVLTFAGWEVAGVCSFLLVSFFLDRDTAADHAARIFVTNRLGDAAFLLGLVTAGWWLGSSRWSDIVSAGTTLPQWQAMTIGACFLVAGAVKSVQVPFSTWLTRAMEGPTPSSALFYGQVLVHCGVYLVLRLAPLWEALPALSVALVVIGAITAAYGAICGLVQTDMKSALAFGTIAHTGAMFAEVGLGWTTLAALHLTAHAVWRGYQFLTAPSILAHMHGRHARLVPAGLRRQAWLYVAALQRGWIDDLADRWLVKSTLRIASDLARFDAGVLDRATGLPAPAVRALSSLAVWEERQIGPTRILESSPEKFASGRGVLGSITAWAARASDWLEDRLVVRLLGEGVASGAERLGRSLGWVEVQLERPSVVVVLVVASVLALLGGVRP